MLIEEQERQEQERQEQEYKQHEKRDMPVQQHNANRSFLTYFQADGLDIIGKAIIKPFEIGLRFIEAILPGYDLLPFPNRATSVTTDTAANTATNTATETAYWRPFSYNTNIKQKYFYEYFTEFELD